MDQFPRSMPPPAPKRMAQSFREEKTLNSYRAEIARRVELRKEQEVRRLKEEKKLAKLAQPAIQAAYGRLFRVLNGKSMREVGRISGLAESTISDTLNGRKEPKISNFLKLARALGWSSGDFYRYLVSVWKHPYGTPPPLELDWRPGAPATSLLP